MEINKKVKILNTLINEIDGLYDKKSSPEFNAWQSKTEIMLSKIFSDKVYAEKFKEIEYYSVAISWGGNESDIRDYYNKGLTEAKELLKSYIYTINELIEVDYEDCNDNISTESNKVFVVHGRDNEIKLEVARLLEKLKLEPIILHEQASGGKTIIEKIEAFTNVRYGIILYTPCDTGALNGSNKFKNRARQNVVFEHGYLIGKIGRENVAALVNGDVETPNDIAGVVYINMNSNNWQVDIAKELKNAGFNIDFNNIF